MSVAMPRTASSAKRVRVSTLPPSASVSIRLRVEELFGQVAIGAVQLDAVAVTSASRVQPRLWIKNRGPLPDGVTLGSCCCRPLSARTRGWVGEMLREHVA